MEPTLEVAACRGRSQSFCQFSSQSGWDNIQLDLRRPILAPNLFSIIHGRFPSRWAPPRALTRTVWLKKSSAQSGWDHFQPDQQRPIFAPILLSLIHGGFLSHSRPLWRRSGRGFGKRIFNKNLSWNLLKMPRRRPPLKRFTLTFFSCRSPSRFPSRPAPSRARTSYVWLNLW